MFLWLPSIFRPQTNNSFTHSTILVRSCCLTILFYCLFFMVSFKFNVVDLCSNCKNTINNNYYCICAWSIMSEYTHFTRVPRKETERQRHLRIKSEYNSLYSYKYLTIYLPIAYGSHMSLEGTERLTCTPFKSYVQRALRNTDIARMGRGFFFFYCLVASVRQLLLN